MGEKIVQPIVMDASTSKGKDKQTLNFKAWLVGETDAPDLGQFETLTTFQITYPDATTPQRSAVGYSTHNGFTTVSQTDMCMPNHSNFRLRGIACYIALALLVDRSMHGLMIPLNLTPVSLS